MHRNKQLKKHIKTNAIICFYDENDSEKPLKIIDGQHRFLICQEFKLPINYIICKNYGLNEVQILKMKTEFQIDKLSNLIQEKTLSFIDLMKIYVQELEEEFIQSK